MITGYGCYCHLAPGRLARRDGLGTLRFLIHDRDPLFTAAFAEVFKAEELQVITTRPKTPRMNSACERVIGALRRELLDRTLMPATWPICDPFAENPQSRD